MSARAYCDTSQVRKLSHNALRKLLEARHQVHPPRAVAPEVRTSPWITLFVSSNRCVNTLAKEKPAACQNHTLVTRKPTPKARKPTKDIANAVKVISHARQYAAPPCTHRLSARKGL